MTMNVGVMLTLSKIEAGKKGGKGNILEVSGSST